jgi:predicted nucleotidyltransferase
MKPSTVLAKHRAEICDLIRRFRATNPRVFGSVVRGEDRDDSDLDLLVDVLPGTTLFDLGGLQIELEDMLGVPIDLVTIGELPPKFRSQVLQEARPV